MVYRACFRASPGADAGRTASAKFPAVSAAPETRQFLGRAGDGKAAQPAGQQLAESAPLSGESGFNEVDREDHPPPSARDNGAAPGHSRPTPSDFRAGTVCDAG